MNRIIEDCGQLIQKKGDYYLLDSNEIEAIVKKIHGRIGYIPGIDPNFVRKCLQGITSLHDNEVDEKIRFLAKFM